MITSEHTKRDIMMAALRTGREEVIRLFAQLVGCEPCPKCDYIKSGCRCPKP